MSWLVFIKSFRFIATNRAFTFTTQILSAYSVFTMKCVYVSLYNERTEKKESLEQQYDLTILYKSLLGWNSLLSAWFYLCIYFFILFYHHLEIGIHITIPENNEMSAGGSNEPLVS